MKIFIVYAGNIKVRYRNTWGPICKTGFTEASARVLCHMIGFGTGVYEENSYRQYVSRQYNSPSPLLSNVACNGTEKNIDQCRHDGWGFGSCYISGYVGIRCSDEGMHLELSPNSVKGV